MDVHGEKWNLIRPLFPGKNEYDIQSRWNRVVNPELVKGPWTKEVSHVLSYFLARDYASLTDVESCRLLSLPGLFPLSSSSEIRTILTPSIWDYCTAQEESPFHMVYMLNAMLSHFIYITTLTLVFYLLSLSFLSHPIASLPLCFSSSSIFSHILWRALRHQ